MEEHPGVTLGQHDSELQAWMFLLLNPDDRLEPRVGPVRHVRLPPRLGVASQEDAGHALAKGRIATELSLVSLKIRLAVER
jgi:hypothetical protein